MEYRNKSIPRKVLLSEWSILALTIILSLTLLVGAGFLTWII